MTSHSNEEHRKAVARFLEDFKELITTQKPLVSSREKNWDTLKCLGMTLTDQWRILQSLNVEDYVSGPKPDRNRRGAVWEFGVNVKSVDLYIKLKISEYIPSDTGNLIRQPVCISFHIAKYPLEYPLK